MAKHRLKWFDFIDAIYENVQSKVKNTFPKYNPGRKWIYFNQNFFFLSCGLKRKIDFRVAPKKKWTEFQCVAPWIRPAIRSWIVNTNFHSFIRPFIRNRSFRALNNTIMGTQQRKNRFFASTIIVVLRTVRGVGWVNKPNVSLSYFNSYIIKIKVKTIRPTL